MSAAAFRCAPPAAGRTIPAVPTLVDQAIVIRLWDWSETSQTVALFTREHGVLRGLAKGARREKGRFSGGFELLTRGEVVAITKASSDLATLTDWDLQETFPTVRRDLRAHYAAVYFADLVQHFVTDSDPHPALWDALLDALRSLRAGADPGPALLAFQWSALSEAGYRPDLAEPAGDAAPATYGFDPLEGRLTHDPGGAPGAVWRVRASTIRALRLVESQRTGATHAKVDALSGEDVDRANRLLAAYARWVLGRSPPSADLLFSGSHARPPLPPPE